MTGANVVLVPYDPQWPDGYELHAAAIRAALGELARRIEHIGSTSVPGLTAKPIIDMLIVVDHPEQESLYVPQMASAGFPLHRREPEFHEHRLHKGVDPAANIHVFGPSSPEVERLLLFRNLLRRDAKARSEYEVAKQRLAAKQWPTTNDYADAKSDIVERLIGLARISTQNQP